MSAAYDFQFSFDASQSGEVPLKLFLGPEVVQVPPAKIRQVDCRTLVELYDALLSNSDHEKRVSVKTIKDSSG